MKQPFIFLKQRLVKTLFQSDTDKQENIFLMLADYCIKQKEMMLEPICRAF
jgi:hypothetical protein